MFQDSKETNLELEGAIQYFVGLDDIGALSVFTKYMILPKLLISRSVSNIGNKIKSVERNLVNLSYKVVAVVDYFLSH